MPGGWGWGAEAGTKTHAGVTCPLPAKLPLFDKVRRRAGCGATASIGGEKLSF